MNKTKVYDFPTRLLHWLFASLFLGAFFIAKAVDDESPVFAYHMLIGLILSVVVGLRVIWGVVGSKYAKFSSFSLRANALWQYFGQFFTGNSTRTLGHNPASSWSALLMMGLALGLAVSGYFMTSGGAKESLEDIHELMANAFVVVVVAHVAGVVVHSLRYKDRIALSMLSGDKQAVDGQSGIERSHAGVALVFAAIVGAFVFYVGKNYDAKTQQLNLFGNTLSLGEAEEHEQEHEHGGERGEDDDD